MDYQSLSSLCTQVRGDILNMTHKAGSGHPGGSLSAVELLVGLYFSGEMAVDAMPSRLGGAGPLYPL